MAPPPSSHPATPEAEFLRTVLTQIDQTWGDVEPVYNLFQKNLDKLNETLLDELSAVFSELVAGQSEENQWQTAAIFIIFGVRISEFPLGDRALNLELSIAAYKAALQVYTRDAFPQEWAKTQNNLGNAYSDRIQGDHAENLEMAIAAYEDALQVRTRDAFPQGWADLHICLGNAYTARIRGERAENLEMAIDVYQSALQIYTRDAFPREWAMTQNNLGNAYSNNIRGDSPDNDSKAECAKNLEMAIVAYQSALQVCTRDAFPKDWAMTQNNLGGAYYNRICGERVENLEQAIAAYQAALQIRTQDTFPPDWAMTQNNLGIAYKDRIRGERARNLEQAIAAYQAALQVRTRDTFPQDWARTQGNLILALLELYKLTGQADDLNNAITSSQQAQEVAIPGTDAYTNISYTLGTALDYRFSLHNDPADLRQAATAYRHAADTTPSDGDKLDYYEKAADSLYQLGVALTQDGQWYEGLTALEASHAAYRDAHSRLGRADALQQMGRTHYLMSNFDKAGIYFRDALRIYKAEASLPGQAACHAGLGRLMLRLNFIDDAIAELHQACQLYTQLNDTARLTEIQQVYDLAQKVKAKQPLAAIPSPPPP